MVRAVKLLYVFCIAWTVWGGDVEVSQPYAVTANERGHNVAVSVTNGSGKDIRAYALAARSRKSGKLLADQTALLGARGGALWAPGSTREVKLKVDQAALADVEVTLDYVEFGDGSFTGPNSLRKSEYLAGLRAGLQTAK